MRRFDYGFLRRLPVDAHMFNRARSIGALAERNASRSSQHPTVFSELERVARIQSVKGSNAIEGIVTTDQRILSIMDRSVEPIGHDEQEIAGYRDALEYIHANHQRMVPDERTVLELHRMLMGYTGHPGGEYKRADNIIVETDGSGNRIIRFTPVTSDDTPEAMEQLTLALRDALQDGSIDRLLLIPCFILDFLSVHPFTDGNGRMSRLLSLLLFYNSGTDVGKYISFEARINSSKGQYYDALRRASEGWHEGTNDYTPFISYYLDVLFLCYRDLDSRFVTVADKKVNKGNRVEAAVMNSLMPISKKEIMTLLPDVSQSTVEAVLHDLVSSGRVERIGANRNARYRRVEMRQG